MPGYEKSSWMSNLLFLPGLFLAAVFFIPYGLIVLLIQFLSERRLRKQMSKKERFIYWPDLEPRLKAGKGTVIVEQAQKKGHRVWWTSDSISNLSPIKATIPEDVHYIFGDADPFFTWCYDKYLDPESGAAILTLCPLTFPPGFIQQSFFAKRFPQLEVVFTVKQNSN